MSVRRGDREWRCQRCMKLLGVQQQGRLVIRYKVAEYVVQGRVTAVCVRCSTLNELDTHARAHA